MTWCAYMGQCALRLLAYVSDVNLDTYTVVAAMLAFEIAGRPAAFLLPGVYDGAEGTVGKAGLAPLCFPAQLLRHIRSSSLDSTPGHDPSPRMFHSLPPSREFEVLCNAVSMEIFQFSSKPHKCAGSLCLA